MRVRAARTLLLAGLLLVLCLVPHRASAHAVLLASDPPAGAVLAEAPAVARLTFSEPIEPGLSRAELFNADGRRVQIPSSQPGARLYELTLALPAGLANGTYAIAYHTISAADGHPDDGFLTFTIGSEADVVAPAPPSQRTTALPRGIDQLARAASLGGVLAAVGALLCWLSVLRPVLESGTRGYLVAIGSRSRRLTLCAIGVALVGSVAALGVEASFNGPWPSLETMVMVLGESHYGRIWTVRVALLLLMGVYAWPRRSWWAESRRRDSAMGLAVGAAALWPFGLASHAAADGPGSPVALAADWLHLCAAAAWTGGLLALSLGLIVGMRRSPVDVRRSTVAAALPRFATVAIASVGILTLTGLYSAWLEVGSVAALRSTAYGQALLVKLALLVVMLALGGFNHFVAGPRLRSSALTATRFGRALVLEAVLGVGIVLIVGVLTSLPPARDAAATSGLNAHWARDGLSASLRVSPGVAGNNRFTLDIVPAGGALPAGTEVLLRVSQGGVLRGERDIALAQVNSGRFEATSSDLSIAGPWKVETIVRRPNTVDWRESTTLSVTRTAFVGVSPVTVAHFAGWQSLLGTLLGAAGVVGLVMSVRRDAGGRARTRTLAGSGAVALLAAGMMWTGWSAGSSSTNNASPQDFAEGGATSLLSSHGHGETDVTRDACSLLKPTDIQAVTGGVTSNGTPLVDLHGLPKCSWLSGKGTAAQMIIVRVLSGADAMTTALGAASSQPLDGIGDGAAWNASALDLVVRVGDGGFEMQISSAQDAALPSLNGDPLTLASRLAQLIVTRF